MVDTANPRLSQQIRTMMVVTLDRSRTPGSTGTHGLSSQVIDNLSQARQRDGRLRVEAPAARLPHVNPSRFITRIFTRRFLL